MHLGLAALLVLAAVPTASEDPPAEVRVLVAPGSPSRAGEDGPRWERRELRISSDPGASARDLESRLGREVVPEQRYPLLGPSSEPLFGEQWGLENTGQAGGTADADTDAAKAWDVSVGAGIVVAVVDSGIVTSHPDLDGRMWVNAGEVAGDGIDNDGNGLVDDTVGWDFENDDDDPTPTGDGFFDAHGTSVAGVIAAEVDGAGITGMAPEVKLMNLRACDDGFCWSLDAARAIHYAVDMGAHVINLSFGGPVPKSIGDPVMEEAVEYARAHDVLVVTAAGNTHPAVIDEGDVMVPAEFPHSNNISVAASNRDDQISDFSYYSQAIDLAAPGEDVLTTGLTSYVEISGTSFSAPFVSGGAALLLATDPKMGHLELVERLKGFADRPPGLASKVEAGRLNVGVALTHQFVDAVGHLFESDIEWAADEGITKGCNPPTNTRFCPDETVSREVMAAFLSRALSLPPASEDHFDDDEDSIFEHDINRLAEAGITKGCGTRRFCPRDVVDRGQMAAFLTRAYGLTDDGGGDWFEDDDESIFENDIDRLRTAGITKGCNPPANDLYCPDRPVDRGAMAAFLHRAES